MTMIQVGQKAPDFTLKSNEDKDATLSSLLGKKNILLAFFPLAFSPVCTNENSCFRDDFKTFEGLDAQILGISVDSVWTQKAFAKSLSLPFPLLADFQPRGRVGSLYGLFLEDKGFNARATVIVDKEGVVQFVKVQEIPQQRDNNDIIEALRGIGSKVAAR